MYRLIVSGGTKTLWSSCTSDAFDKTKTKNIKVTPKSNTTKVRCCHACDRPDKICKSPVYY